MSKLRPTLADSKRSAPSEETQLFLIRDAVHKHAGLIHGKLETNMGWCAIGSCFHIYDVTLSNNVIDEVAAINDARPRETMTARKARVLVWLEWKIRSIVQARYG